MADYPKLKVAELKELVQGRGLESKGLTKKQQLIDALEADDAANGNNAVPATSNGTKDDTNTKDDAKTKSSEGKGKAKKRAASPEPEPELDGPSALKKPKTAADSVEGSKAQFASQNLHIPVDDECTLASYRVYIDESDGIIYDASLNQTNATNNNNKFYRVQVRAIPISTF
jgi:hypothetical protein